MIARRPAHTLPSFFRYLDKVFDFRQALEALSDDRQDPQIPPQAVFYGFVFRLRSFQQREGDLAEPHLQGWMHLQRGFRDDTLRYSLSSFHLEGLEEMWVNLNRQLKRHKAFQAGRGAGRLVATLDGVEILSSYHRCCDTCLERRILTPDAHGQLTSRTPYYHQLVGCQIISSPVKPLLALEWVRPGEGEVTAGLRLLSRLPTLYGSRFVDLLLLDALYAQAPVLKLAQEIGWDLVVTLKQEKRDLYQDAMGLFAARPPDRCWSERLGEKTVSLRLWEEEQLPFTQDYPQPVRVVYAQETGPQPQGRGAPPETSEHRWVWFTTLDAQTVPAPQLPQLGHDRWKSENNGWNDLTQNWALKHGFLHAGKHRPPQPSASGRRVPGPNRGLAAVTSILAIAFLLFSAFALRHSKIYRLYRPPLRELSRQLYRSLYKLPPPIRSPTAGD